MLPIFRSVWQLSNAVPIPNFNEHGFLPAGVHPCTLQEIRARFGKFQDSDQRPRLFSKLEIFVKELKSAAIVRALIVDGSFVSTTSSPNDIDIILVLAAGHDFTADLSPLQYQIVERTKVRQKHGFDVFIAEDASPDYLVLVRFYQRVRLQPGLTKGILRIEI